ncbi:low affinity Fe/Cu permease [Amorphus suaedae]
MSRRTQENIVAGLILLLFAAILVETSTYGARARMVPTIIAGIGFVLMAAQIILQNVRSEATMQVDLMELISRRATGDEEGLPDHLRTDLAEAKRKQYVEPGETRGPRPGSFARELLSLAVVACAIGLFFLIGPIPTMFVFTFGYLTITGHFGVLRAFAVSALFTLFVYGLFYAWLRIDMKQGLFDLGFGLW